jgi:hypothetical protein
VLRTRLVRMVLAAFGVSAALGVGFGCGEEPREPIVVPKSIPLEQVPEGILSTARKELPGVEIESAHTMTKGGDLIYALRGRTDTGKTREVEINAAGKVIEKE